jgi:glycosyltransferase involved in cell wall biosynthesis
VITTCYNQADYVHNTLEAVQSQKTTARVYHIVADDGSTDGSSSILDQWADEHPNVRVLHLTNRGVAGAFNACLIALPADVEYVVTLSADDWFEPNFIHECLKAMKPEVDMVVPAMRRIIEPGLDNNRLRGVIATEMPKVENPTFEQIWAWDITYAYGVAMFRRKALEEAGGFHPRVGGDNDWDMWIDLVRRGYRFGYTDKTCFYYLYVPYSGCRNKTPEDWNAHRLEMARHHRMATLPGPEWG